MCSAPDCDRQSQAKGLCLKHYKAARRPRRLTSAEKFWLRVVEDENGCWNWTGTLRWDGYGQVSIDDRKWLAHRYAYEVMVVEIPDGLQIDHLCGNKACVNPFGHLEPVTAHVNNMRSNSLAARRARMTHCSRGHALTPENTYSRPDRVSARMCRRCCQLRESLRVRRAS